tara:strand:+ start:5560 stop:7191 length:1632 start_codon:yes stop_codon:yes gene_type:complete
VLIKYDGIGVFEGQAEPLVAKTTSFTSNGDNRVLLEETISLAGELTGCGMSELIAARTGALHVFATGFKNLEIEGIDTFTGVKVQSISFDDSPYLASLPYNITLLHYPSGGYEVAHGITDPQSVYTYTENQDQTLSIQHEVSARGINTSSAAGGNALANATNFVSGQITNAIPRPAMIDTTDNAFEMYLVDFSESVNKIDNTISINRTFQTDPTASVGNVILRYTSEFSLTQGEETTVTYNGDINAGRPTGVTDTERMVQVRTKYDEFKDSIETPRFLTENVTEDTGINHLSFSFSYISGDSEPDIIDDFTINLEENSDSSLFTASINGNLSTKGMCINSDNFAALTAYYSGGTHENNHDHNYEMCQSLYEDFYTEAHGSCQTKPAEIINLNPRSISRSVGENEFAQTLSYNASYNDRISVEGAHTFDYSMRFTPSLPAVKTVASAYNNGWIFEDLGYRQRAVFSISINARSINNAPLSREVLQNFGKKKFNELTDSPERVITTADEYVLNNETVESTTYARSFHSQYTFTEADYTGIQTFNV